MKKFLIAAAALCIIAPAVANATYYNETFDCGHGQTVWIGNPVEGESRKLIFNITISKFDLNKGPIRSPVVLWNVDRDRVTLDGKSCRLLPEKKRK